MAPSPRPFGSTTEPIRCKRERANCCCEAAIEFCNAHEHRIVESKFDASESNLNFKHRTPLVILTNSGTIFTHHLPGIFVSYDPKKLYSYKCRDLFPTLIYIVIITLLFSITINFDVISTVRADAVPETISRLSNNILSNENFTFAHNGSFLQIDAGREWPFNSKREIVFRFKTKSPHGLLIYQTFDHNKLAREDEQENLDLVPLSRASSEESNTAQNKLPATIQQHPSLTRHQRIGLSNERLHKLDGHRAVRSTNNEHPNPISHLSRASRDNLAASGEPLAKLANNAITATASEKLVNSLFSASPAAAINGNSPQGLRTTLSSQGVARDGPILATAGGATLVSGIETNPTVRNHRVLANIAIGSESPSNRAAFSNRASENVDGSTVLSSSTISSFSASLYELYLKLENGRLKIMYEFGTRLNQTYCGKGLNDDRWHRVDLRVDPEINQMVLILDQMITVEIVLSQLQPEDESTRRSDLVFTNSILYVGGLNNNASIFKNVKQRLYMAQFIGCIGQIQIKTDQHTESTLQPATIDRMVLVRRGCLNRCDTDNYCLHKSTCVNYYSHTKCDCFGTNYEDIYCWKNDLTTLTMLGYSTLVYRIYDWRDRHHSSINRLSLRFKTMAQDSILFFGYGDLSAQNFKNIMNSIQAPALPTQTSFTIPSQTNLSNPLNVHRPMAHQSVSNSNYLAVSLTNGSIVVEVNFGDQPIMLSNMLYDKTAVNNSLERQKHLNLADNRWHNITFLHSNRQLYLQVDNYSAYHVVTGKNNHLYFDPSIYIGGVPNLLLNETKTLARPFNLRHKFVGCLKSVYFNQHNILMALRQNSTMVEYRDILSRPRFGSCIVQEPNSLPLTMRSGKSYLTFQLAPNSLTFSPSHYRSDKLQIISNDSLSKSSHMWSQVNISLPLKKLTKIEFEYKTSLRAHFLAGGHLRDLSYHDLGGFWTLHAREDCQLYFTISSGLTYEPEQVIQLDSASMKCEPNRWYRVFISTISGDKILNITRQPVDHFEDDNDIIETDQIVHKSYILKSSIELLHQVQIGGDLAKFGESSSVPFTGCIRRIKINDHLFDSRDFVSNTAILPSSSNINQQNLTLTQLGVTTQSDVVSSRMAQGYVTLDSCSLVNPCSSFNPCKNNGICKINELGEPDCDCTKTGYTGRRCHFSIYKQSCHDLYLSGQRKSSHYLIDLDRNGPLRPIRVRCNMEEIGGQIETVLTHNLPNEYPIRRSTTNDIALDITYLAFHHMYTSDGFYMHDDNDEVAKSNQNLALRRLIGQSLHCRQYFRFECRSSPLELGNMTWMEAPFPKTHRITSLSGSNQGQCACATSEKKCIDPTKNCNCDSAEPIWSDDSYEFNGHDNVGLTKIVMLKQNPDEYSGSSLSRESRSRFTLGDLKCLGSKQYDSQHEITFKTSDAYIEVPGWRRGDISFSFRTASSPPAIILYQLATSRNHGYFRLTLISDVRLLFEFIVNRRPRKMFLTSTHKLNNGQWQQVFIEYDQLNLRLTVNDDTAMLDLDINDFLGTFEGPLFIGGAPSKYLIGDLSKRNGFTGCFRSLNIDGKFIDLRSHLSPSMPTVISGCQPSCSKNLCQNGGKCIEYWGSYECECSNPIAHSGSNCEINLNTNSITFIAQESYYVQLSNDSLPYPAYLVKNLLLNIRTYQESALILYASDHQNNFIQLHKNRSSLVLSFNSNNSIVVAQVPINNEPESDMTITNPTPSSPPLVESPIAPTSTNASLTLVNQTMSANLVLPRPSTNTSTPPPTVALGYSSIDKSIRVSNTSGSGQPIQVKIERHRLRTTFYVNNNFLVVEKPLILLNNYSQNPWLNPELETVRPLRPKLGGKLYSRMFLANIDEYFNTRLPGFTGCIQGLSIDNQLFDFNRAHLTGEFKGDYKIGCKMHCDSFPCKNQGTCIENWLEDKIQCRCDTTSYVGRLCDEDIAAMFNGQTSYFLYHLSKKFSSQLNNHTQTAINPVSKNITLSTNSTARTELSPVDHQRVVIKTRDVGESINYFEVSLAFSTDANQSSIRSENSIQVIVLLTRANSSRYFLLGLTQDGSLLIQEDYGNSMSLSRLIKRQDHAYNDGHRHMVKYSRYNQTIQIIVDYQTYLPTMSVIPANQASKFSKHSLVLVGTAPTQLSEGAYLDAGYSNYSGCISNLLIKLDGLTVEPLSEAFGQNLETINATGAGSIDSDLKNLNEVFREARSTLLLKRNRSPLEEQSSILRIEDEPPGDGASPRMLSVINKLNGKEAIDNMEIIEAKDVEQGRCATFKRVESSNEKRSINEPKNTPLLEPRPVYMDPPRIKMFKLPKTTIAIKSSKRESFGALFYCSAAVLIIIGSASLVYAYILQVRYKSEKFRCETPFFHKRDSETNSPEILS